jgi:hypothetical protein
VYLLVSRGRLTACYRAAELHPHALADIQHVLNLGIHPGLCTQSFASGPQRHRGVCSPWPRAGPGAPARPTHVVGSFMPYAPACTLMPGPPSLRYPASPRARRRWATPHAGPTVRPGTPTPGTPFFNGFTKLPRLRCPVLPSRPRLLPISYGAMVTVTVG